MGKLSLLQVVKRSSWLGSHKRHSQIQYAYPLRLTVLVITCAMDGNRVTLWVSTDAKESDPDSNPGIADVICAYPNSKVK